MTNRHLLIYDGACAFCCRCIEFARALDEKRDFDFAPFQTAQHPLLTPEVRAQCADAVHLISRGGKVFAGGRACFYFLEHTSRHRFVRRVARMMRLFPLVIPVEIGYQIVARNRGFFSRFF